MIEHKVIEVKTADELEKALNKHSKDGWMPTTNPMELRAGGYLIVMSRQKQPQK